MAADVKSKYIGLISSASKTRFGDELLKCMDYFHATNTMELTEEQVKSYYENEVERKHSETIV